MKSTGPQTKPRRAARRGQALAAVQKSLLACHELALGHPRAVLATVAALLAVFAGLSTRISIQTSIDDIVNGDFTTTPRLRDLKESFSDKNELFVAFSRSDGLALSHDEVCGVQSWLLYEGSSNLELARSFSAFSLKKMSWAAGNEDVGFESVLDPKCAAVPTQSQNQLTAQLDRLAASPWGGVITPRPGVFGPGRAQDLAVDLYLRDARRDARPPTATTQATPSLGSFDPSIVGEMMRRERSTLGRQFPELVAHWTGMAAFQYYVNEGFRNFLALNLAVLFVLTILMRLLFGTFRAALALNGTLLAAGVFLHGTMGLLGFPLEILSNNLFLLVVVSTIEDFLFVSFMQTRGTPWREAYRALIVPGFFTSLSTAVGFASLAVSDLEIIRRFGVMAALGSMIEWAMVFLVLPSVATLVPMLQIWVSPTASKKNGGPAMAARFSRLTPPRGLARAALLVYPLALVAGSHLHVSDSPERTFPPGHPFSQTVDYMFKTRQTKAITSLVFKSYDKVAHNRAVLAAVAALPDVAAVENPYLAEDYILAEAPRSLLSELRRDLRSSFRFRRYAAPAGEGRALVYLRDSEIGVVNRVRFEVDRLCPAQECWLAGTPVSYAEFGERLRSTLLESLALSLLLVAAVLVFLGVELRARSVGWLLASAFWGPAAMLLAVGAFRVPIDLVTCVFAATLVGLAGDNAVQFLFGGVGEAAQGSAGQGPAALARGLERLGGAPLLVTTAMAALALCFLGSAFAPPRELGLLLAAGFVATLAGDVWLLRGLLKTPKQP